MALARLVRASGRGILASAEQLMNDPSPIVEMAAGRVSSRSEAAPRKELLPRLVRATGKLSSVREEHSARASLPIVVRAAGRVSLTSFEQLRKAFSQSVNVCSFSLI